jgi:hypothetical protein
MTAEEADAQFAALVATYRAEKKPRRHGGKSLVDNHAGLAMLIVYLVGVGVGAYWHNTIGKALVLGVLVAAARWAWMRFSPKDES